MCDAVGVHGVRRGRLGVPSAPADRACPSEVIRYSLLIARVGVIVQPEPPAGMQLAASCCRRRTLAVADDRLHARRRTVDAQWTRYRMGPDIRRPRTNRSGVCSGLHGLGRQIGRGRGEIVVAERPLAGVAARDRSTSARYGPRRCGIRSGRTGTGSPSSSSVCAFGSSAMTSVCAVALVREVVVKPELFHQPRDEIE